MSEKKPTALLVHGAFADGGSWAGVIAELENRGITAIAVPNDLTGAAADGRKVAALAREIDGPVVLVGHSYGGAVITSAANDADNVTALVYVTAFALDEGEGLLELLGRFPANELGTSLAPHQFGDDTYLSIVEDKFPEIFAADVPAGQSRVMARSQRPIAAAAFEEKSGAASWKRLPSYYLVATADNAIPVEAQRAMAERAGSKTTEVDASHAVAVSQPLAVAEFVASAVEAGAAR
ncbi:alpha/beta fold hydrolase [Kribbella sp. ALI-6-A]|uniref:alpha/beta fold hydrolase n=1 Tax=Kribbella sp. ALI-6-A TaxID=1933817 RepID=UPI001EDAE7F0|nr:alpha/beta hydrolase [Kribbella sp. ALI-6-A]